MARGSIRNDVNSVLDSPLDSKIALNNAKFKEKNFKWKRGSSNASELKAILDEIKKIKADNNINAKTWKEIATNARKFGERDKQAEQEAREDLKQTLSSILNDPEASKEQRDHARRQLTALNAQEALLKKTHDFLSTALPNILDQKAKEQLKYLGSLNTRLQGTNKNYNSILKLIDQNVGINAYIKQSKVFEKLNDYVSQGIAYNVEQRAFLGTISEKIAATFEANNAALLQIVKIQQADSTAARLGMESSLNNFLNKNFQDTSYLSGLSDSVSSAILGTSSQLSRNGSVEFEYAVQKWLGSMSSVGVSESTIQSLAQGINALGTGDVNALSGNSGLQNLLVMSANKAGLNYSKLLSVGMNANTTSSLLKGMVEYLHSIGDIQNHVVKTQYANLFGMTISDLTALLNLSSDDLTNISKNMYSYAQLIDETSRSLTTLNQRTSVGEMAENIFDNVMSGAGRLVTSSTASYLAFLASNVVGDTLNNLLGETKLSPMGVGTSFKAGDLLKATVSAGFVGSSLLSSIYNNHSYGLSVDGWGASDINHTERGTGTTLADTTTGRGVSQTIYVGNSNTSDFYSQTLTAANDRLEQVNGQTKSAETAQEVSKIADITRDSIDPNVRAIRDILEQWNIMGLRVRNY